jgi:uncharacterized Fe-S center protein
VSKVYFIAARQDDPDEVLARRTGALWEAAGLAAAVHPGDLAALKLHVGEPGRDTHVRPAIAAELVRRMKSAGARPFLTDTAVLYKSPRDNGVSHALVAHAHGFSTEAMDAPFIPADGLAGAAETEVAVDGRHYDTVAIATGVLRARSLVVLSHATGHLGTGMGAALKNLGMGCASKKGKLRQHHGQQPAIDPVSCTACGECAAWCPSEAIEVEEHAVIDPGLCIGCGECVAVCQDGAVAFQWAINGRELSERVVEHAAAIVRSKPGRVAYLTVATAITKDCDCMGRVQEPVVEDLGLLASFDPVAIDMAVLDLVRERAGRRLEDLSYPDRDAAVQVRYAEELGLGSASWERVDVLA